MMNSIYLLLIIIGLAKDMLRPVRSNGLTRLVGVCPPDTLYLNPYEWPAFATLRFIRAGRLLTPTGQLTERSLDDCGPDKQFRFGQLYFIENRPNVYLDRSKCMVWCSLGRDTMRVIFFPYPNQNVFYDSIPFRPGTFLLRAPSMKEVKTRYPKKIPMVSLASYYEKHAVELSKQNVFANFYFRVPDPCCRPKNKKPGAPDTPAQIFESLLRHTTYVRVQGAQLVPIHRVSTYQKGIIGQYKANNSADSTLVTNP